MRELEASMAKDDAEVCKSLDGLAALPRLNSDAELATATARYAELSKVKTEKGSSDRTQCSGRGPSRSAPSPRRRSTSSAGAAPSAGSRSSALPTRTRAALERRREQRASNSGDERRGRASKAEREHDLVPRELVGIRHSIANDATRNRPAPPRSADSSPWSRFFGASSSDIPDTPDCPVLEAGPPDAGNDRASEAGDAGDASVLDADAASDADDAGD